jgi:catechol 2,3-dioxygenase-like lactoylglutathione lyase family enzyme
MLPPPGFHHLHLNSVDPDAAIAFYTRQFPSTAKGEWAGLPALLSNNNVMVLFNKVDKPPAMSPPSAIWHFGWHVPDVRRNIEVYKTRPEVKLLPLYTTDEGGSVLINSDTWPAPKGGAPGLTRAQIAEAKANHVQPAGGGGFAYMEGPEGVLIEYVGNPGGTFRSRASVAGGSGRGTGMVPDAPERPGAAGVHAAGATQARHGTVLAGAEPGGDVP